MGVQQKTLLDTSLATNAHTPNPGSGERQRAASDYTRPLSNHSQIEGLIFTYYLVIVPPKNTIVLA